MNIVVLPSWYPPNGGEFFRQQSQTLSRQGHHVKVIVINVTSIRKPINWLKSLFKLFVTEISNEIDGSIEVVRLDCPVVPRLNSINLWLYSCAADNLYKYILMRGFKPDVLHVHSLIWAGVAARKLKLKYKLNYFVTEHRGRFIDNNFIDPEQKKTISDRHVAAAAESAGKVYAVSAAMLPALKKIVKKGDVEFGVIPNMVDTNFFSPLDRKQKNTDSKFRFFSLASLIPLKGFIDLLDAFSLLKAEMLNVELIIGGDGHDRVRIEEKIATLGLQQNVILLGHLDRNQVRDEMRKADAFVLASRYEAFGVVFIEAMACGLPIVATRSGGSLSIVSDDVGYLSDVGDIQGFAHNMKCVINDYAKFDPFELYNLTKSLYSEEVVGLELIRHLKELSNVNEFR